MATTRLIIDDLKDSDLDNCSNDPLFKNSYPTAYLTVEKFIWDQFRPLMSDLSINVMEFKKNMLVFETIQKKSGEHKFQTLTLFTFALFVAQTQNLKMVLDLANWLRHNMQKATTDTSASAYENYNFRKAKAGLTLAVPIQHILSQAGFDIKPVEDVLHLNYQSLSKLMGELQSSGRTRQKVAGE